MALVKKFASEYGLDVVSSSVARRSVVLAGTVAAMTKAFNVALQEQTLPDGDAVRTREGAIMYPVN